MGTFTGTATFHSNNRPTLRDLTVGKELRSRIASFRTELSAFSYSIRYRLGKGNVAPGELIRVFCASVLSPPSSRTVSSRSHLYAQRIYAYLQK